VKGITFFLALPVTLAHLIHSFDYPQPGIFFFCKNAKLTEQKKSYVITVRFTLYTMQLKVQLTLKMAISLNETTCLLKHFREKSFAFG